jgi:hypothetical protein
LLYSAAYFTSKTYAQSEPDISILLARGAPGWSWGCFSQIDFAGCLLFTADAHRDDGKFIVSADES